MVIQPEQQRERRPLAPDVDQAVLGRFGDICTCTRQSNWRGFPCAVDAGALWFDASGHPIEDGVHADYREEWQRIPAPDWAAWAAETDIAEGLLISNDTGFVLGLGQRDAPASPTLVQALREGAVTERADRVGPDGKRGRAPHCLT